MPADYRPPPYIADKPHCRHAPRNICAPRRDHSERVTMIDRPDPADYSIAVRRNRKPLNSWRWEIYRPGKSTPVERSRDHFQTMAEATRAGKEALQRLVRLRLIIST
jgi:hypothetical protein